MQLLRNTVAEIVDSSVYPEQVVATHSEASYRRTEPFQHSSWDVGQGAMDDGGGAFISWQALSIIKNMKLPRPKRTLRLPVMWTGEESDSKGIDRIRCLLQPDTRTSLLTLTYCLSLI